MAQHHQNQQALASPRKFNITDGLRSFHKASAFLPGFVVDNCNGKIHRLHFFSETGRGVVAYILLFRYFLEIH